MSETQRSSSGKRSNGFYALACLSVVAGMAGLAYASVPLYQLFCQVTGYGGTTQKAVSSQGIAISEREVTVRFDANIDPSLGWDFKPVERQVTLKLGETIEIAYVAENISGEPLTGTATFNVTPQSAGAYFNKIDCFCFTETTLQPGEKLDMPVVFFVDPEMLEEAETKRLTTLTLSYTFYRTEPSNSENRAAAATVPATNNDRL